MHYHNETIAIRDDDPANHDDMVPDNWSASASDAEVVHPSTELQPTVDIELATLKTILGYEAVKAGLDATKFAMNNGEESPFANQRQAAAIDETRNYVGDLTESSQGRKFVNQKADVGPMPLWLKEATGGADRTPAERMQALTETRDGKPVVSDATVQNYMEWYGSQIAKRQETFEHEVIGSMRLRYAERFQQAIEQGWLPANALTEDRLQKIMTAPVKLHDGLGPDISLAGMTANTAQADVRADEPHIQFTEQTARLSEKKIERVFIHEMTHIITGLTEHKDSHYEPADSNWPVIPPDTFAQRDPSAQKSDFGVERLFDNESAAGRALNEATTEHFTIALQDGNIDRVSILKQGATYASSRYLLNRLCTAGRQPVSPRLFVAAMFETEANGPAVAELRSSVEQAFPGADLDAILNERPEDNDTAMLGPLTTSRIRQSVRQLRRHAQSDRD